MQRLTQTLTLFLIPLMPLVIGCEGPQGPEGPEGGEGPEGPVGQVGEDGSEIHAGSGAPDASLGGLGDFYLDKDNYELYGPKTENGWGTPINLKGADGNADVTRYIFPGHDFNSLALATNLTFSEVDSTEMRNST